MDEKSLNKIADFIQKYAPQYTDREVLKEYIKQHFLYKTAFVMKDGEKIVAVCRWNINDDIADIMDLYIKEEYRGKKIIQQMLQRGLWLFPQVKKIRFERFMKYGGRQSIIPVEKILRGKYAENIP